MLLLILVGVIALQVRQWRRLNGRMTHGALAKPRAIVLYVTWALAPTILVGAALFVAIGLEAGLGVALIGEEVARAVLPVGILLLGVALIGSLAFGVTCGRSVQHPE